MKWISLFCILSIFCTKISSAATITAIQDGSWNSSTTWDLGRVPADADEVVIPVGMDVSFSGAPYPKNTPTARPTLHIKIYGNLDFSNAGNDKLYLDAGSTIQVYAGGQILTTHPSMEIIAIYNGASDNTVWTGSPTNVGGPAYATAFTTGFSVGLLPLTLLSFKVAETGNMQCILLWETTDEYMTSHFDIEKFELDFNRWMKIGEIKAAGYSYSKLTYSFKANLTAGLNQFRLKQVDIDAKFVYSAIRQIINSKDEFEIIFSSHFRTLKVTGSGISENKLQMFVYDLVGRKIMQKQLKSGTNDIPFPDGLHGLYIAQLKNGHKSFMAKKIFVP